MVGAFGFTVGYYFIATAMVFGSIVSASCWEPFRRAIEKMTEVYYENPELETKYAGYLEQLKFEPIPEKSFKFTQAIPCKYNKGIIDENGKMQVRNYIYVDDCWLIAVHFCMRQLLAACIHAIFMVTGFPNILLRPNPLAMDKWVDMNVSWMVIILGLKIDTRKMTIGMTDVYLDEVRLLPVSYTHLTLPTN